MKKKHYFNSFTIFKKVECYLHLNEMITLSHIFQQYSTDIGHLTRQLRTNNRLKQRRQHQVGVLSSEPPVKIHAIINITKYLWIMCIFIPLTIYSLWDHIFQRDLNTVHHLVRQLIAIRGNSIFFYLISRNIN